MSKYRLLADHYVGDRLLEAGSIVSTGVELPVGWVPSLAVDPIDGEGTQAFFDAGPTGAVGSAEHGALSTVFNGNRWTGVNVAAPNVYWEPVTVNGVPCWQLHGALGYGHKDDM